MIRTENIGDGVRFHFCGGGFKKNRMEVFLRFPLERRTLTPSALLPYLLERGTREIPDNTMLKRTLQGMYGAKLDTGYSSRNLYRVLDAGISGADGALVGEGEDVRRARLLLDVLFDPYNENGEFKSEWVDIEREKHRETINAAINDKRDYCFQKLDEVAFDDERSLPDDGFPEDLSDITPGSLFQSYRNVLKDAEADIFFVGEDSGRISELCKERFSSFERAPRAAKKLVPINYDAPRVSTITMPVEQDKLAMLFSTGTQLTGREYAALRLGSVMLGGSATSRMFNNIREKQSLCYYISSMQTLKPGGGLVIDCGMAKENREKVAQAALHELKALSSDGPLESELSDAKLLFQNIYMGIGDSARSLISYHYGRIMREGATGEPEDELSEILSVKSDEICDVLSRLKLCAQSVVTAGEEQG